MIIKINEVKKKYFYPKDRGQKGPKIKWWNEMSSIAIVRKCLATTIQAVTGDNTNSVGVTLNRVSAFDVQLHASYVVLLLRLKSNDCLKYNVSKETESIRNCLSKTKYPNNVLIITKRKLSKSYEENLKKIYEKGLTTLVVLKVKEGDKISVGINERAIVDSEMFRTELSKPLNLIIVYSENCHNTSSKVTWMKLP